MTIDERLERLTERHEALTQTVEFLAAAQIGSDERVDKLTALVAETDHFINRLAHIAEAH
jgi:archaellum component FlaC